METCGTCVYCLDMKKYGGPGKKKACEKGNAQGAVINFVPYNNNYNIISFLRQVIWDVYVALNLE